LKIVLVLFIWWAIDQILGFCSQINGAVEDAAQAEYMSTLVIRDAAYMRYLTAADAAAAYAAYTQWIAAYSVCASTYAAYVDAALIYKNGVIAIATIRTIVVIIFGLYAINECYKPRDLLLSDQIKK